MKKPNVTDPLIPVLAQEIADEAREEGLTATTYELTKHHGVRLGVLLGRDPRGTLLDPQRRELEAHVRYALARLNSAVA